MRGRELSGAGIWRRLMRVSLRGLLLLVAALCACLAVEARRLSRQRSAIAWVQRQGGVALYGWQLDASGQWTEAHPPYPRWLMRVLGPDCFQSIKAVDIFNAELVDIRPLAELTELEDLELNGNWIRDLRPLTELRALRVLHLADNRVDDIGPLAELPRLTTLMLDGNEVQSLEPLRRMESLTTLFAAENRISDLRPLHELAAMQARSGARDAGLRYVDLGGNPLAEGDVAGLRARLREYGGVVLEDRDD